MSKCEMQDGARAPSAPPPISPLTLTNRTSLMGHPVCRSVHCTQSKLCNEKIKSHFTMVCLQKVFFYGDKLPFLTFFDFAQNFWTSILFYLLDAYPLNWWEYQWPCKHEKVWHKQNRAAEKALSWKATYYVLWNDCKRISKVQLVLEMKGKNISDSWNIRIKNIRSSEMHIDS